MDMYTVSIISLILGTILSAISLFSFIFIKPTKAREEKAKLEAKREWEEEQEKELKNLENQRIIQEQKTIESLRSVVKEEVAPILKNIEDINDRLEKIEENDKIQKEALLAGASDALHRLSRECQEKKYAGEYERIAFNRLYASYRKLGGNHEMEGISQLFNDLPLTKDQN